MRRGVYYVVGKFRLVACLVAWLLLVNVDVNVEPDGSVGCYLFN